MRAKTKYKIFLAIDIALVFMVLTSISGIVFSPYYSEDDASQFSNFLVFSCCTLVFFLLLVAAILATLELKKEAELTATVATHFKLYRRDRINNAARKLNMSTEELVKTLMKLKGEGELNGYFDETTGEFVVDEAVGEELYQRPVKCPSCGGYNTKKVMMGDTPVCQFCGAPLTSETDRLCPYCGRPGRYDEYTRMWVCDYCRRTFK